MNVGRTIDTAVARVPDRIALVVGDQQISYQELEQWVRRVAAALAARGVGRGQRVALLDSGSVLAVATILAAARVGASSAQMNVQLTAPELRTLADAVEARIGVAGPSFRAGLADAIGPAAVLGEDDVAELDGPHAIRSADEALEHGDDEALVLFTSGTTGLPKPISISHGVVSQRLRYYASVVDPDAPQATDMMSAPIFHIGGTLGLLISLHAGHKLVVLPRFDAGSWLRAVEEHQVSQTFVVPTMLQRILDHPDFRRGTSAPCDSSATAQRLRRSTWWKEPSTPCRASGS